jgi:hypothetical protein
LQDAKLMPKSDDLQMQSGPRTVQKLDAIEIIGREEALPSCMMTPLKGTALAPLGGLGWSDGLNRRLSWVTSQ